jgi:hypothetical protein
MDGRADGNVRKYETLKRHLVSLQSAKKKVLFFLKKVQWPITQKKKTLLIE